MKVSSALIFILSALVAALSRDLAILIVVPATAVVSVYIARYGMTTHNLSELDPQHYNAVYGPK